MKFATRNEEDDDIPEDTFNKPDEDDVMVEEPDDEDINEENYSTRFDIEEDPDEEAGELSEYGDE
jgi:hypothetical protein